MDTIVVNLFGGPGVGKSSMCASVFSYLKWKGVDCEMVLEYAKDCVWSNTESLLKNQIFIFGQQHNRIFHLLGKVNVIITDSPLLLSIIYDTKKDRIFRELVLSESQKLNNFNFLLSRRKKFNPNGRIHTEEDAKNIDKLSTDLLNDYNVPFKEIEGISENASIIGDDVINLLSKK
jgi:hypothetical protein